MTKYIFTRMIAVCLKGNKQVNDQTTSPLLKDYRIDYLIEPTIEYTRMTQIAAIKTPQVALYV